MAVGAPVNFDGTNDFLSLAAPLTGVADGKIALISFWFRDLGSAGGGRRIFNIVGGTTGRYSITRNTSNQWSLIGRVDVTTLVLDVVVTAPAPGADTDWHHLIISTNQANVAERAFYIDGVDANPTWNTYVDNTIDFDQALVFVGSSSAAGANLWNGDMAELYFHTPATWFDITNPANLAKFRLSGAPIDLGSDGSDPLGVQPLVCLNAGTAGAWATNVGSGGGFTETGALDNGAVPLPTVPVADYDQVAFQIYNDDGTGLGGPP